MLKNKKQRILKNKFFLLYIKYLKNKNKMSFFLKKNCFIKLKFRTFLNKKNLNSKKFNICLFSGKKKSINSNLKINRSVLNKLVQFNYLQNIKKFE